MKNYKTLIAVLIGIIALFPSAFGIEISVSSNAGGFTEVIDAGFDDRVSGSTIIGSDRLSNSIQGNANLNESHSVSNKAGATAEVGVDIRNAEWYSYSYDLWPGQGSSWKASKYPQVAAGEDLDVLNASYIEAYASASSPGGYKAGASTVILDPANHASLTGYHNLAMASKNEAFASQTADWASSPNGYIQAEASADFTQLKSKPLRFREDNAEESMRVDRGSIEGYSDLASASAQGIMATQQVSLATGEDIQTRSEASFQTASLFQSLKTERAKVNTQAEGSLTGYNASAKSFDGNVQASQTGHIIGSFSSTAIAGSDRKTRSSNYGTIYDFDMQAKKNTSGSYATGSLGYYIDNASPAANRIQGAVDASESGDAINVAPGTYFENVQIDKSLTVKGSGAGSDPVTHTIVDGGKKGSVFTIGQIDPEAEVSLQSITIQNGSGTYAEMSPGNFYILGGGILNRGTLHITSTLVSGNTATYGGGLYNYDYGTVNLFGGNIIGNNADFGSGIYNYDYGIVNLFGGNITRNNAYFGSGIYNDKGTINLFGGNITGNNAGADGGGIYNYGSGIYRDGTVNFFGGNITGNNAAGEGGGVYNDHLGKLNLFGGNITENSAYKGGGIFSLDGTLTLAGCNITGNNANYYGGAIYNAGTLTIANVSPSIGSTISYNTAKNGGGIFNDYSGIVNLYGGSIDHNNATSPAPSGGGIFNLGSIYGDISIVHDNTPDQIANDVDWLPEI